MCHIVTLEDDPMEYWNGQVRCTTAPLSIQAIQMISIRGLLPILVSVVYNHPPLFLALGVQLLLCTGCRTRFQSGKPARDPSTSRPAAFEASLISWTKVHEWRVPPCWH